MKFSIKKEDLKRVDDVSFMYPLDVVSAYSSEGKATGEDKALVGIFAFVIVTGIVYLFVLNIGMAYGIPWWLSLLIQLAVEALIFKKFIANIVFGIDKKRREQLASKHDNVLKYIKLNLRVSETVDVLGETAHIYGAFDSTKATALRFRLGSTDDQRAEITRQIMEDVQLLCSRYSFESRFYTINEVYEDTREYQNFYNTMSGNNIRDDDRLASFREAMLEVAEHVAVESSNSNVPSIVLVIKSLTATSDESMRQLLVGIKNITYKKISSIRYLEFVDKEGTLAIIKQYFGIPVVDLSNLKSTNNQSEIVNKYRSYGSVHSVTAVDGTKAVAPNNILAKKFQSNTKVLPYEENYEPVFMEDEDYEIYIEE